MKKQTISKIAALSLAAMTVMPMFGISASADVTLSEGNASNGSFKQAWGTANKAEWQINSVTETLYELEPYKVGEAINYKLKVASTSTTNYTSMDTDVKPIKTPDGSNPSLAPYGCIFYAYSNSTPPVYSDSTNTTPGVKDVLDKAKKDSSDDKAKIDTALRQWNAALTATANAKKNTRTKYQMTLSDGKVVYAWSEDGTTVVYYNETNLITTTAVDVSSWDFGKEILDGTTAITLSDGSTSSIDSTSQFKIYTYNYTAGITSGIPLTSVVSNLGATHIKLDSDGTSLIAGVVGTDYKVVNGGEIVPDNNADGSNSGGVAEPDKDNNTTVDISKIESSGSYSATFHWYSAATKRYYKTYADAVAASNGVYTYVSDATPTTTTTTTVTGSATYSTTYHYYSALTGRYYRTYADALAASGGVASYVTDASLTNVSSSATYSTTYPWYSSYTKRYYKTYSDALAASNGISSYVTQGYYDPYYYYYYGLGGLGYPTTSTSTKDTSNVTIGSAKGWTSVTKTINAAKSGSTYTVNMKGETEVPSSVLSALQGKNVNINFVLSNGVTYTVNGTNVNSTSTMDISTRTGTSNVPTSLKKKAVQSNDGISSSQISISSGSLSASSSVTVKFNANRAGCSAKLYRYDASSNTLKLVSSSAVQSTGKVTFGNVNQGGDYLIVLS